MKTNNITAISGAFVGICRPLINNDKLLVKAFGAYSINWGDDSPIEHCAAGFSTTHQYNSYAKYVVIIQPELNNQLTELYFEMDFVHPIGFSEIYIECSLLERLMLNTKELKIVALGENVIEDFSRMFRDCQRDVNFLKLYTSRGKDFSLMFANCQLVLTFPPMDTSKGTNFSGMYSSCYSGVNFPQLNTSRGVDLSWMYDGCRSAERFPVLDESNARNCIGMYCLCENKTKS